MIKKVCAPVICILLVTLAGFAQSTERDIAREQEIWQRLEKSAPKTLDDFKSATSAMDEGYYEEAARLYQKVLDKAPDFDPALRRLGLSLVELGRVNEGITLLEKALQKNRSSENLISLARSLVYPGEGKEGSTADKTRALELAKEAARLNTNNDDPSYLLLATHLTLDLNREDDFRSLMKNLVEKHPNLMETHYFSAILAAFDEDWIKAEDEIKKAQQLGLPDAVAENFLGLGVKSRATVWRYAHYSLYMVAAWLLGLGALFAFGKILSNQTLSSLDKSDPNIATDSREISLRKFYRNLINAGGYYYYISIPVVIFLIIAIAASIIYGFLLLGRIPVQLVAVLVIGGLITIYKMIRTLFVKIEQEDPGRTLREDEAPGLWAMTREIAQSVGTHPIDEIRITPGTELAVYEKGSFRERMQDKARRILILGTGVLNDFKQNSFRAVLAHEYGHFSNRDTAGGDVAMRVNYDMAKFAEAIILSDQAVWWNVGFQFLRVYNFIFRRITHGATRLQEILADRVAVRNYGADAFEEGLRHVIRRQIEFEDIAYWEITDASKSQRSLQNLYDITANKANAIEDKINESINRQTSEDDTHPSPTERFRLAKRIISNPTSSSDGMVWELFANRELLTGEMSALVEQYVKAEG